MDDLKKSILATLAYYDVLDYPLTAGEVFKFLINPNRFDGKSVILPTLDPRLVARDSDSNSLAPHSVGPPPRVGTFDDQFSSRCITDLPMALDMLVKNGELEEKNGFYFLPGRMFLYEDRVEKNKIAEQKWKKARRYLFLAQAVPYIEAIFASGSLALGHTDQESDLDVLVVAKSGRIWLARLLLSLCTGLLGVRRKNEDRIAPDKICLNHYITTASLKIPFASLYNAQSYAHLVPVYWRDWGMVEKFWEENGRWAKNFLSSWELPDGYQRRAIRRSRFLGWIRTGLEKFLDWTGLSVLFEKLSRKIQIVRIKTDLPGRITADDRQLEFHPYSAEKDITKKYNRTIFKLEIFGDYQETDSGLR